MTTPSVETVDPPAQDERAVICSWHTEGYRIWLEDTGNAGAAIMCNADHGIPTRFGDIKYDEGQARHFIEWTRAGCMLIDRYKRDHWDTKFYSALAEWRRG
jgi:hypothetical protein